MSLLLDNYGQNDYNSWEPDAQLGRAAHVSVDAMRLAPLVMLLSLVLAAAPAGAAVPPWAKARMTACETSLALAGRSATFEGDMKGAKGAVRLQIKFVLQVRTDKTWTKVAAPGFGVWNTSDPGIGRYVYRKTVESLPAPADYRVVMHFRWMSVLGKPLLRATRTSRVCRQPDLRPDLEPQKVTALGNHRYSVIVRNRGRTAAGPFAVTATSAGQTFLVGTVDELAPGESVSVDGEGPDCGPLGAFEVRVDAEDSVDESEESGNALTVPCPRP
jgi:hypothetical protein